ncbi:uncharacterized protein LOC129883664 [Solanum dulcamara]|uniref:uncharacterized protein LOC129883664 n=1 Tax=Solanum dulcamara TaxID=45834 RepID=UPI0024865DFC|nr:uncharacterized protein LOC129883664 [Solanum dulcamara]
MEADKTQSGQGVCEKIFKLAVNISPTYRSFHRISTTTKPKIDHHMRKYTAKPILVNYIMSEHVLVEYNHIAGDDSATHKFNKAAESMKGVNKSSIKNKITIVHHHEINEGPKDHNDRFSNYIDHVKNKMRSISSFDDDKVTHCSKFKIN